MRLYYIPFFFVILLTYSTIKTIPNPTKVPIHTGIWQINQDYHPSKPAWIEIQHHSSNCRIRVEMKDDQPLFSGEFIKLSSDILIANLHFTKKSQNSIWKKLHLCVGSQIWLSQKDFQFYKIKFPTSWTSRLMVVISKWRAVIIERVYKDLDTPFDAYINALFLGDKSHFPKEDLKLFKDFGLLYLLAISGFHIQFLFQGINRFSYLVPGNPHLKTFCLLLPFFLYIPISGFGPAVCRAIFGESLILGTKICQTSVRPIQLWITNLLLCLAINPMWIFHLGFQLSFLATLGIQELRVIDFKPQSMAVGLRATITTLPIILIHFEKLSLIGFGIQLLVAPWVALVMYMGLLVMLLKAIQAPNIITEVYLTLFDLTHFFQIEFMKYFDQINQSLYLFGWSNPWLYVGYFLWLFAVLFKTQARPDTAL